MRFKTLKEYLGFFLIKKNKLCSLLLLIFLCGLGEGENCHDCSTFFFSFPQKYVWGGGGISCEIVQPTL